MNQFKMSSAESESYQSKRSGSEKLSNIWSNDDEEKEQELNENFGMLFAYKPKAPIPSAKSSSIQPGDIGLEEKVEETTDRTSNLGW